MADQRQLNAYLLSGVLTLLQGYNEDGEKKNLSYTETVKALRHTIDSIQERVCLDFSKLS